MLDRTPSRRDALRKTFREEGVEGVVISSFTNVTYLTAFTGDDSALFLTENRAIVVSDGRYTTQLQAECPDVDHHIRPVGQPLMEGVVEIAAKLGVKRLGFEASSLSVADFDDLKTKYKTGELKGIKDRVERLRMVKDAGEVDAIREAIDYAERAFAMLRAGIRRDESEKDVTDVLESYMRRCGASAASFPPIVAVGRHAALPHYHGSSEAKVGDDDFILVDWGACAGPWPYKSDLTRVLVTGRVTPQFERVYEVVLQAQLRGIQAIRPGRVCRDVDAEARAVIVDAGFGEFYEHGLGHGLGLDIHEAPRLRRECEIVLEPGMVVTVEPGIYLPDWGGIRIEDDVLVTENGCEVLTKAPKTLDSVLAG
ncbi:MAG: Xaa-Pro peptidase family protein [Isosphaeraceae bacterium]